MQPATVLIGPKNTRFDQIHVVAETGSTNADLLSEGLDHRDQVKVLVAHHQSSGRGRLNRVWLDRPGDSLLISVMAKYSLAQSQLLPFVAGMAVAAVAEELGADRLGLKWPNDVLVDGMKLAGILVEAQTQDDSVIAVIGCGINLLDSPGGSPHDRAITIQSATDKVLTVASAANYFLQKLELELLALESQGRQSVIDRYSTKCVTLGRAVEVETSEGVQSGTASRIGSIGQLVVTSSRGAEFEIFSGDARLL